MRNNEKRERNMHSPCSPDLHAEVSREALSLFPELFAPNKNVIIGHVRETAELSANGKIQTRPQPRLLTANQPQEEVRRDACSVSLIGLKLGNRRRIGGTVQLKK